MTTVAAVDIGATSGRVIVADLAGSGPRLTEVARFGNGPVQAAAGAWVWPIDTIYRQVLDGLTRATERGVRAWGIDTWAVDYGVLAPGNDEAPTGDRGLLAPGVRAYRDPRHARGALRVEQAIAWPSLYRTTGIQAMPFNTVNQIAADDPQRLVDGSRLLLVPDLLSYWATGVLATDVTNASSTGMVDVRTRQWSRPVIDALGLPAGAFLPLDEPGQVRGESRSMGGLPLIGVATHDTASAFAGTPIADRDQALVLSLGTWALIGAEVVGVVPSEVGMTANLTHELGVDGTVRILRNVSGMWLLEECRRAWADGQPPEVGALLEAAERAPAFAALLDVDAPALASPGQSPVSIAAHLDQQPPGWAQDRGAVVRSLLESLVIKLARRATEIEDVLGGTRETLHVVGGASRMTLLMQWLADATGKRVVAGPVEATALGNALVQWRTLGAIDSLGTGRALVAGLPEIRTYEPSGDPDVWRRAAARLSESRLPASRSPASRLEEHG